jgi:hypothetical protein
MVRSPDEVVHEELNQISSKNGQKLEAEGVVATGFWPATAFRLETLPGAWRTAGSPSPLYLVRIELAGEALLTSKHTLASLPW